MISFDFKNPPIQNIAYLSSKSEKIGFDYDEIMHEAHHTSFTIAKITKIDLLHDMKQSLLRASSEGQSFEEWKKNIKPLLKEYGWLGKSSVINPSTKEEKQIYVGARRLRTIYYTNMRVAYTQARAKEQYSLPQAQYLRYVAINDNRTRHSHKILHGLILHRDHDFWKTCYPPNGYNCRCRVQAYTKDQLRGKEISQDPPPFSPHKDWEYDTRNLDGNALQHLIKSKMQKYKDKDFQNALINATKEAKIQTWKQGLDEMIREILINKNLRHPRNIIQIGEINNDIIRALRDANIEGEAQVLS